MAHVVAWPADGRGDLSDRRHWHSGCWRARDRRGPNPSAGAAPPGTAERSGHPSATRLASVPAGRLNGEHTDPRASILPARREDIELHTADGLHAGR